MSAIHKYRLSGTGALLMGLSVIMGAFGAHLLGDKMTAEILQAYRTGVLYALIHSMAMLMWPLFKGSFTPKRQKLIWQMLFWGLIFFSGSLWTMGVAEAMGIDWHFLGVITPIGGVTWTIAWFLMAYSLFSNS